MKEVAAQFSEDFVSDPHAVSTLLDSIMKATGGFVIVDFLDCGNWDGLAGYEYDEDKRHLYLYWHDYRADDASGRTCEKERIVFAASLYGLFLHLQGILIVRGSDSAAFLLQGYALTPKEARRILAPDAEEFQIDGNSLFAAHVRRKVNDQWHLFEVHTAALFTVALIPKGTGIQSISSRKLLFHVNLTKASIRIQKTYEALEQLGEEDVDAIAEKGNTIRRALEQILKIEVCYREVAVKKPYSQLLLGDLLSLLKNYQESDSIRTIYGKFAEWANELSHDTGKPVERSKARLLAVFSLAYVEMLRLSTRLDPFPSFSARMAAAIQQNPDTFGLDLEWSV